MPLSVAVNRQELTEQRSHSAAFHKMTAEEADIVQAFVLGLFTTVAVLGNIIVCVIVYKHRWILHPTNDFVISLALLDILTAVILLPLTICVFIGGPGWMFGKATCSVDAFFNDFAKYASICTLCFIAIQRYYRFLKPLECNETFTPGYTLTISICIWIGSSLFAGLPVMAGWADYTFSYEYLGCWITYNQDLQQSVWNTCILLLKIIPTFLTFYCYRVIYGAIRRSSLRVRSISRVRGNSGVIEANVEFLNSTKKYRLTKTFLVISIVFVVSWLPPSIIFVIDQLLSLHLTLIGSRILRFSTAVALASKVFIYGWVNRPFRRELFNLF